MRYQAFISYSHSDERWARWLQASLERYRIPKKLRRQPDGRSPSQRLQPIFRDRDELASASDLSEAIREALAQSRALILICSPRSAGSRWVNEEVRCFQALGRGASIFCLLVEGTTDRTASDCAIPPALLWDADGGDLPEPLAADVRVDADGKRSAMLKIAAGLLGVRFDDLRQRDAQRQLKFRTAIAGTSLVITVATIGLAIAAHLARDEANLRRNQAENLISFMLEDLRARLEPVGRLDLLDAVGDEAMGYFAALGSRGTEQEMFARAMALRQIGEVRFRQGRLAGAQGAFEESRNVTQALYDQAPENQRYLFELAQSEFWVGYAAHEQSLLDISGASYRRYMEYSRTLLSLDPQNPDYQLELMYAYSNLGAFELDQDNPSAAVDHLQACLALNQRLLEAAPGDLDLQQELGDTFSWIGETRLQLGELESSAEAYRQSMAVLSPLHESGGNIRASEHFGQNSAKLGDVLLNQGDVAQAATLIRDAFDVFDDLVRYDEENWIWRSDRGISAHLLAELMSVTGDLDGARNHAMRAIEDLSYSMTSNPGDLRAVEHFLLARALLAFLTKDDAIDEALSLTRDSLPRISRLVESERAKPRTILNAAKVARIHGEVLMQAGSADEATATWLMALGWLGELKSAPLTRLAIERQLHALLRNSEASAQLEQQLLDSGFNDPRFF